MCLKRHVAVLHLFGPGFTAPADVSKILFINRFIGGFLLLWSLHLCLWLAGGAFALMDRRFLSVSLFLHAINYNFNTE